MFLISLATQLKYELEAPLRECGGSIAEMIYLALINLFFRECLVI